MFKNTLALLGLSLLSFSSYAALHDRGNGLIYDDVLDITWLQDASYAITSGYDTDGLISWDQAETWISSLNTANHLGVSSWRLPSMDVNGDAFLVICSTATENACRDNELGYMAFQYGVTNTSPGIFESVAINYWSSTDYDAANDDWPDGRTCNSGPEGTCAWRQGIDFDSQNYVRKYYVGYSAWPVADGDVAGVPGPKPDLVVRVDSFSSLNFATSISAVFQIENIGDEIAGNFEVVFLLQVGTERTLIHYENVPTGMGIGQSISVDFDYNSEDSLTDGVIIAVVDFREVVDEGNETNNIKLIGIP